MFTQYVADLKLKRKWVIIFISWEYYERSTILFNNCCEKIKIENLD